MQPKIALVLTTAAMTRVLTPGGVVRWLSTEVPALGNEQPVTLITLGGSSADRVVEYAESIVQGSFS